MKYAAGDIVSALAIAAIAALGGGFAVFAGYDDAPGGVLLGMLLVAGAAVLGLRTLHRRR